MKVIRAGGMLRAALFLGVLACMWGCGSGGSTPPASIEYVVLGTNMNGVAAIDLSLSYDSSKLSSPTVTQGALISAALFVPNTNTPGSIHLAVVSAAPLSGSGPIAQISFAAHNGAPDITISAISLLDGAGHTITGPLVTVGVK